MNVLIHPPVNLSLFQATDARALHFHPESERFLILMFDGTVILALKENNGFG